MRYAIRKKAENDNKRCLMQWKTQDVNHPLGHNIEWHLKMGLSFVFNLKVAEIVIIGSCYYGSKGRKRNVSFIVPRDSAGTINPEIWYHATLPNKCLNPALLATDLTGFRRRRKKNIFMKRRPNMSSLTVGFEHWHTYVDIYHESIALTSELNGPSWQLLKQSLWIACCTNHRNCRQYSVLHATGCIDTP